jgi:anthranilate phosphoribosyltransferase
MLAPFLANKDKALVKDLAVDLLSGKFTMVQIGAFLMTIKHAGYEVDPTVINNFVAAMKSVALVIDVPGAVDIVGTGGDGQNVLEPNLDF